jgi:hypothetical protein
MRAKLEQVLAERFLLVGPDHVSHKRSRPARAEGSYGSRLSPSGCSFIVFIGMAARPASSQSLAHSNAIDARKPGFDRSGSEACAGG